MARFVSFNGDTIWWNIELFNNIGIGENKYGLKDTGKEILAFRNSDSVNSVIRNETIIVFTGNTTKECQEVLDRYNTIIKDWEPSSNLWLEAEHESYDSSLFHKIELIRQQPYDGHNNIAWVEYEILGRYIDPKQSQWTDEASKLDEWWGSELLYCSQIYGECEKAAEASKHLITI